MYERGAQDMCVSENDYDKQRLLNLNWVRKVMKIQGKQG